MTSETKSLLSKLHSSLCPNKLEEAIAEKFNELETQIEQLKSSSYENVGELNWAGGVVNSVLEFRQTDFSIMPSPGTKLYVKVEHNLIHEIDAHKVFLAMKAACGIKESK